MTQFGLAGTFRTEEIEDGEGLGLRRDHVAKQGGKQEGDADFGVVTKDVNQLPAIEGRLIRARSSKN